MHGIDHTAHLWMHKFVRAVAQTLGYDFDAMPTSLHYILHIVVFWGPLFFLAFIAWTAWRWLRRRYVLRQQQEPPPYAHPGLPVGIFQFILVYSRAQQILVVLAGLAAMPILYTALELPKRIINGALAEDHQPATLLGVSVDQTTHLLVLCSLYLFAVLMNGAVKFWINVYKGKVGERLLRRLRLTIYRLWRSGQGTASRSEAVPIILQEVEPIGGFASDSFALPVFQGGTFITILVFMFIQDPILGAAAITLLPVQLALIPRLQRKLNRLSRERVAEVRYLGGELGMQATQACGRESIRRVGSSLKRIESIRQRIHRSKYFIKSLNNFLTALTPFFFYSIGGYLVIEGRLSLGALVAVLAAYKDFSAPLRELFRYYQSSEDVRIRYSEIQRFLSSDQPHRASFIPRIPVAEGSQSFSRTDPSAMRGVKA